MRYVFALSGYPQSRLLTRDIRARYSRNPSIREFSASPLVVALRHRGVRWVMEMNETRNIRRGEAASSPEVTHHTLGSGVAAIEVRGELDLASVGELATVVERALNPGPKSLVIDFTRCAFIDSSVLSLLVDLRARLGNSDRPRLAVVADDQPLRVLRLTGLDAEIPVFASLPDALTALEPAAASAT
jgi:anti-anti-sigma factor